MRISTASQKTDRQQEELTSYAELNQLNFNRNLDVFIDVVSGFKDGEERQYACDRRDGGCRHKENLRYVPFSMYNYVCWMVNNDSHRFVYDRNTQKFSEIKYGRTVGRYNFTEFDQQSAFLDGDTLGQWLLSQ